MSNIGEDVVIKINGLQVVEDTGDDVEVLAAGKHYLKKDKHYLLYDEIEDETQEKISNIIKFNNDIVEIIRKGAVNAHLVFEESSMKQSLYSTPMGDLLVEVLTKNIELKEQEKGNVDLKVKYQIHIDGNKISDNEIEINATHR